MDAQDSAVSDKSSSQSSADASSVDELSDAAMRVLAAFQRCDRNHTEITIADVSDHLPDQSKNNLNNHVRENLVPGGFVTEVREESVETRGVAFPRKVYALTDAGREADPVDEMPRGMDAETLRAELRRARDERDELRNEVDEMERRLRGIATYLEHLSGKVDDGRFAVKNTE